MTDKVYQSSAAEDVASPGSEAVLSLPPPPPQPLQPPVPSAEASVAAPAAGGGGGGGAPPAAPPAAEELDFDSYNDAALVKVLRDLEKRNAFYELENRLFTSYLSRVTPNALRGEDEADDRGPAGAAAPRGGAAEAATRAAAEKEGRGKKKRGEKGKEQEKPVLLVPEQKSEIATRELEELRDEIEKQKQEWEKRLDSLKVGGERRPDRPDFWRCLPRAKRADLGPASGVCSTAYPVCRRCTSLRGTLSTEPSIQGPAELPPSAWCGTLKIASARRYLGDFHTRHWHGPGRSPLSPLNPPRVQDHTIEKIRLKNTALKVQKNKLALQLKQKEEMGEVLHAIDFDQLTIENQNYQMKIEERNSELLKLKLIAGNSVQVLNQYKKRLPLLTSEAASLKAEIVARDQLLDRLKVETAVVEAERAKAASANQAIKEQLAEYRMPSVMDYVEHNARLKETVRQLASWERKVEIAEMALQRAKKASKQLSKITQSCPPSAPPAPHHLAPISSEVVGRHPRGLTSDRSPSVESRDPRVRTPPTPASAAPGLEAVF
ncbi:MAG: hypothetical protein BJ554DRAFT_1873 [Olpidium bornovanus]|uniref:Cilia- and flagella-associated protein 263 n=1 Tax=Olpidium bornovanus TaxID=278681 RepID=A0A8H8A0W0_9FUNG|nr:MAG: hypothetical protein BJ554DRAFT_1873 [Olpidium bornovanus]